jgi:hypothetical protein
MSGFFTILKIADSAGTVGIFFILKYINDNSNINVI